MGLHHLLAELKRRRVFRAAAVYAVAAWAAIEVATTVSPLLRLPEWVPTLVLVLCGLGFPIVVALAWVFDVTPQGVARTGSSDSTDAVDAGHAHVVATGAGGYLRRRQLAMATLVVVLASVGGWAVWVRSTSTAVPLDDRLVAVFPFRVSAGPSLSYLREGLVDLLETKLTGGVGPRAMDSRSALSAWRERAGSPEADLDRDASLELAREMGAGQLLLGSVVGTPTEVTVSGTLYDVATGEEITRAADIAGSPEAITDLVDRLATSLLALGAGESGERLGSLTSTSFAAVKLYLEGKRAYRRGRYAEGAERLAEATRIDSLFTLAAMEHFEGSQWGDLTTTAAEMTRNRELARRHADRLSDKDRVYFDALLGPVDGPEERLARWESVVRRMPEMPEGWFHLGTWHMHSGMLMGRDSSFARARAALERAIELDPSYASAVGYVMRIALHQGDVDAIRALATQFLDVQPTGESAEYLRWLLAAATGDTASLERTRPRMDSLSLTALGWIWGASLTFGLEFQDAQRAVEVLGARATTQEELNNYRFRAMEVSGNAGRFDQLLELTEAVSTTPELLAMNRLFMGLNWGSADTTGVGQAFFQIDRASREARSSDPLPQRRSVVVPDCFATLWLAQTGDAEAAAARRARSAGLVGPEDPDNFRDLVDLCLNIADAAIALAGGSGDAAARALAADSMLRAHPGFPREARNMFQLWTARLLAATGRPEEALATLRRRELQNPAFFLASILREEGRLAAQLGDREGAIRAYTHYLGMRTDPDPAFAAEVEQVRTELAALTGEGATPSPRQDRPR